jgi:predicted ribosome quality control (RQC) complex YloA/Tae2 family protein
MAFDGVLLSGLSRELQVLLTNGRIDRIHQPETDEIHILIRNNGENYKLLLSASASYPRIHLTRQNKVNPLVPPMFCMVLRKHLTGGRLLSIRQPGFERILEITFEVLSEMGDLTEKKLIIEIMGRHSNIIFTDKDSKILDSIKHVGENISRVREVLPGKQYVSPPSQGKSDPLTADREQVISLLQSDNSGTKRPQLLADAFTGVSRVTAEEICRAAYDNGFCRLTHTDAGSGIAAVHSAAGSITEDYASAGCQPENSTAENDSDRIAAAFACFFSRVREGLFQPAMLLDDQGKPKDVLPFPYGLYPESLLKQYPSFSEAMDDFFETRDRMERGQQRTASLHRVIKNNLDRCSKKLALQQQEVEEAKKGEIYKLYGELITSNMYNIPAGVDEISLNNYYDPDNTAILVPMDNTKTASQNAQSYYKMYNKSKTVTEKQTEFIRQTREELLYLESLAEHLSMCAEEADILEIKEELIREGYIRRESGKGKPKQRTVSRPHHYLSSEGFEIFVGKNNIQNDQLTLKMAVSNDLWLHTKVIPGSHVIVKALGRPVPETTLSEAANLAAYYSKGRASANVPVDYCPRKNVKKPGGAKPGMVIYEQYKTIYITPSEQMMRAMKKL